MLLPRCASALRIWLLRRMGAAIGRRCLIEPRVKILMPWNLEMGDDVAIGREVEFLNFAPVRIDSMTVISQYSYLCTGTHDYTHPHFPLQYAPIFIGPESWLAAGVFVGPGVTIGRGAVIGARSVVTRSMPEWMVCAGHPCRPLKPREVQPLKATLDLAGVENRRVCSAPEMASDLDESVAAPNHALAPAATTSSHPQPAEAAAS